jgi:hypothetical protein
MQHRLKQTKDSYLVLEKGFEIVLNRAIKQLYLASLKVFCTNYFKLFQANIFFN